jgi:hypothetical protein
MAAEVTLQAAANKADANMFPFWVAGTVDTKLAAFATTSIAQFPDSQINSRPIANWLTLIAFVASQMPAINIPLAQYEQGMQYVYRACLMAQFLQTQGTITGAQAAAMLASYNLQF